MAHTPGPWNVAAGKLNIAAYVDGMWVTIADVPREQYGIVKRSLDQREADARLIAAAPDLLEACEAALARIESDISATCDEARQLRAAIKKVQGV